MRAKAAGDEWLPVRPVWIIWYAVLLHIMWGCLLLLGRSPYGATAVHVYGGLPRDVMAAALLLASGLAAWGVTRRQPTWQSLATLLPQQAVLAVSACAATLAVITARYGDGVTRPRLFILADQAPALLVVVLHTAAVIEMHARQPAAEVLQARFGVLDAEAQRLQDELAEKAEALRVLRGKPPR